MFDVDGYRFGCAICIEVNFPSLFIEYERLGVDCLLLSAWPVDSIFFLKARSHAAIHNYWLSLSVPSQSAELMPSAIIGPDGGAMASIRAPEELTIVTLDRDAPEFHIAVNLARPWRAEANQGDIYRSRRINDPRSTDRTAQAWSGTEEHRLGGPASMWWNHVDADTYRRWIIQTGLLIESEEFVPEDTSGHQLFCARRPR